MWIRRALILTTSFVIISCAHHRDVRPGVSGEHRVVVRAEDTDQGARNAISQANHFCEKRNKVAAFVKEKKEYTGDMDESNYKNAKRATKVAEAVGGAAWVFGKKGVSSAGGIVGIGGAAADSAIGNGYTVDMVFKCI